MSWNFRNLVSLRLQCTSIANRVPQLIWPFLQLITIVWPENVRKLISLRSQCTSFTNRFFSFFDRFMTFLQLYDKKCQKTHISANSVHKYHKSFFLAYLTVLRLITTIWPEMSENSYLRDLSAQVSRINSIIFFDYSTAYYKCKTWNVRKLIFPRSQCTSITKRFLSLFDCFTAYNNTMTWFVRKTQLSANSVHKYHKSFS